MASRARHRCFVLQLILVALASIGGVGASAPPMSEKEIPKVPLGVVAKDLDELWREAGGPELEAPVMRGAVPQTTGSFLEVFTTKAPIEELVRFYARQLEATEPGGEMPSLESLRTGAATPVVLQFEPYSWQLSDGDNGQLVTDALKRSRQLYAGGVWIQTALFTWTCKTTDTELSVLGVAMLDRSFKEDLTSYSGTETWVAIERNSYRLAAATRNAAGAARAAALATATAKLIAVPPTPETLGAPLYPNAVFDAGLSAGLSMGNPAAVYIFSSADEPAKVAAFYGAATGKKAESMGSDSYLLALEGQFPFPKRGITVQPNNLLPTDARTVISFAIAR